MQTIILQSITKIESQKQARRVVPCYALCYELCRVLHISKPALMQELAKMQAAGVALRVGNTINDNYILLRPLQNYLYSPNCTEI